MLSVRAHRNCVARILPLLLVTTLCATEATAQESDTGLLATQTGAEMAIAPARVSDSVAMTEAFPRIGTRQASTGMSQGLLRGMYVTFAALQVLDAKSTSRALAYGGREANPIMKSITSHRGTLMAVKVGVAASTIWLTQRVARKNRVGAIIMMAALNSVYATVVAHNYGVAREMAARYQ